jgi:hypothetical protein
MIHPKLLQALTVKVPPQLSEERLLGALLCNTTQQLVKNQEGVISMQLPDSDQPLYLRYMSQIINILQEGPAKASEIAYRIGIRTTFVNSFVYGPLSRSGVVRRDSSYNWHLT